MIQYTLAEKTEKKLDMNFIIGQARAVLKDRYNKTQFCSNALGRYHDSEKFTVEQASRLIEQVVDDTLYYDGAR